MHTPGIRQAKVTQQGVKDASERVCIHALDQRSKEDASHPRCTGSL